jgi:hypothetical protein
VKRAGVTIVFVAVCLGVLVFSGFTARFTVRQSGHGFGVGNQLVLGEYGYSDGGDRLRYAIFRTWPKESTQEQRSLDARRATGFLGWPLIRDIGGFMIPVAADGNVYFFEGDNLKQLKVRMNEHTDTMPLDNMKTLDEVWDYLRRFRVD